ncbi:MAG: hypothetical protein AAFX54_19120 [Pseudomonadota bacterium]
MMGIIFIGVLLAGCDNIFNSVVRVNNEMDTDTVSIILSWSDSIYERRTILPASSTKYTVNASRDGISTITINDGTTEVKYGITYVTPDQATLYSIDIKSVNHVTISSRPKLVFFSEDLSFELSVIEE